MLWKQGTGLFLFAEYLAPVGSRGMRPHLRPILAGEAAFLWKMWVPTVHLSPKFLIGASAPPSIRLLEGRPPCRPTYAGRSPAPIRPTKPRWRAGKVGADGAAPSRRDDLCLALPCPPRPSGPLRCASLAPPSASVVSSDLPVVLWNGQCRRHFRDFVAARRRGSLGSVPRVKHSALPANCFVQPP